MLQNFLSKISPFHNNCFNNLFFFSLFDRISDSRRKSGGREEEGVPGERAGVSTGQPLRVQTLVPQSSDELRDQGA